MKLNEWKAEDYLTTSEEIEMFLSTCLEEGGSEEYIAKVFETVEIARAKLENREPHLDSISSLLATIRKIGAEVVLKSAAATP